MVKCAIKYAISDIENENDILEHVNCQRIVFIAKFFSELFMTIVGIVCIKSLL